MLSCMMMNLLCIYDDYTMMTIFYAILYSIFQIILSTHSC